MHKFGRSLVGVLLAIGTSWSCAAWAQELVINKETVESDTRLMPTIYPDILDHKHATTRAVNRVIAFFHAKSSHVAADMVAAFAPEPEPVAYLEAGLGFTWPSQDSLLKVWSGDNFANGPESALSYPLRVVGDDRSVVIEFVNTPELLGREYRFMAALAFNDEGKIVRWVDYWDGRAAGSYIEKGRFGPYPDDFRDTVPSASEKIRDIASRLQSAFADGDADTAGALFAPDAVFEDISLHARIVGRIQITRYLTRVLKTVPYGHDSGLASISGGDMGGGFEWIASGTSGDLQRGIAAIELNDEGKITRFSTLYDSFQLSDQHYADLIKMAAEDISRP